MIRYLSMIRYLYVDKISMMIRYLYVVYKLQDSLYKVFLIRPESVIPCERVDAYEPPYRYLLFIIKLGY